MSPPVSAALSRRRGITQLEHRPPSKSVSWTFRARRQGSARRAHSSTMIFPRIMFIPQVNANSPGSEGVNSTVVVS